jgi:hypothetical protein
VPAPLDARPAWSLFVKKRALRKQLTRATYEEMGLSPKKTLLSAAKVAELIEEERGEMHQPDHYHGLYEDRLVEPGDIKAASEEIERGDADRGALRAAAVAFTGEALAARTRRLSELRDENRFINALAEGHIRLKKRTVMFRGEERTKDEIIELEPTVKRELAAAVAALNEADRVFFRYFWACSADDLQAREELWQRYEFLLAVQKLVVQLGGYEPPIEAALERLRSGAEMSAQDFANIRGLFAGAREALAKAVKAAKKVDLPKLSLVPEDTQLDKFILPERVVEEPGQETISGAWVMEFLQQFGGALRRLRRLHFKNLGALLALGERLDPTLWPAKAAKDEAGEEGAEA